MNFFLSFHDSVTTQAYSTYIHSKWPSWALIFKCTLYFRVLASVSNLIFALYTEIPDLSECYQAQAIFGFSLTIFGTILFFISKWKRLRAYTLPSLITIVFSFVNIVVSYELYFLYSSELDLESQWISKFSIIYEKVFPTFFLAMPYHTWWFKSLLVALIIAYSMLRASPWKLFSLNAIYTTCALVAIIYLFYKIEKDRKNNFLEVHAEKNHSKLIRNLFDSFPEGLLIMNKNSKPFYINQAMRDVLGTEGTEESILKKINHLNLDIIIPEIQKYCESPLHERSYSNNNTPRKLHIPAEPAERSHRNLLNLPRGSPERDSIILNRPVKAKSASTKLGLPVPSIYLDDLKSKRKVSNKYSSKENSEDYKNQIKENSLFLDHSSPRAPQASRRRSTFNMGHIENNFKIKVESEGFKGYATNPIKTNNYYTFNLYEDYEIDPWRRGNSTCEDDRLAYEVKYWEAPINNETYKFLIISDISVREKTANLEESHKYKNLMFASISHEFRTPVNGILSLLEASMNELKSQKIVQTHLKPALNNAHLLMFLINDLLDYSNILVDKLILSLETFSVRRCLEGVKNLMEGQAINKELPLKILVKKDAPIHIKSDKTRIEQILVNLLSNSLKFTKQGSIEVIAEAADYSSRCLKISVIDTGLGLNATDLERLNFAMNNGHVNRKVNSSSSGIGMGLMITQSLALALGPSDDVSPGVAGITIESQYGKGSIFQFVVHNYEEMATLEEIPTVESMPEERSPESAKSTIITLFDPKSSLSHPHFTSTTNYVSLQRSIVSISKSLTTKKIMQGEFCLCPKVLIVDDTSYNVFALRTLLNSFSIQSDAAYDGKEACEMIAGESVNRKGCCGGYRLIFMDCNMPVMDGYGATREINRMIADKEILPVPIIGWTAYTDKISLDECLNAGMEDYITKPVSAKTLEALLKRYELVQGK